MPTTLASRTIDTSILCDATRQLPRPLSWPFLAIDVIRWLCIEMQVAIETKLAGKGNDPNLHIKFKPTRLPTSAESPEFIYCSCRGRCPHLEALIDK